jgi:hypothetical protein
VINFLRNASAGKEKARKYTSGLFDCPAVLFRTIIMNFWLKVYGYEPDHHASLLRFGILQ